MVAVNKKWLGWKDIPSEVERTVSRWDRPIFALAGQDCMGTEHRDTFFWEAEEKLFGKRLPAHRQTIGDCVSHGGGRAVQDLWFRMIAENGGSASDALQVATEPGYALSRVEIGRGQLGNGDGSVGAWYAEAMKRYGVIFRKKYDRYDLRKYSGRKAKEWGAPRKGCPDILEPIAREYPVRTVSLVQSDDEAMAALYNWYPISVCSQQGFTTQRRAGGWCDPRGSWAHCMEVRGICEAKDGRSYDLAVVIQQSWGENPTGNPTVKLRDREIELPQGCFLVKMEDFERRMLRARDSYAYSDLEGYVRRVPRFPSSRRREITYATSL